MTVEETQESSLRMAKVRVFTQENLATIPERVQVYEGEDNEKLRDIHITWQMVQDEICKLRKNKSPGPDEIFPRVLKESKYVICEPLADIFKISVGSGYVTS